MPDKTKPTPSIQRPSRSRLRLLVAGVSVALLAGGAGLFLAERAAPVPASQAAAVGGPFTLTDGAGRTVTAQDFRGRFMLVYFGYTFCPDVCPTTLNDVSAALDKLGTAADRIRPVFITIDPARDTPAVMKQYTAAFSPRLEGLTGTPEQIAAVAKAYHVYYAKHANAAAPADYTMDHSSVLYLMGPDGGFVGVLRADQGADAIAADLARMTAGGSPAA